MPIRPSTTSRAPRNLVLLLASAAAGTAAALAPAALTGIGAVDVVERAVVAAGCTYVGAHGRRLTWIVAAAFVAVPARGASLLLALGALVVLVPAATPRRRSRNVGAVGLALLVNVPFWYDAGATPYGPVMAVVAFAMLLASGQPFLRRKGRRIVTSTLLAFGVLLLLAMVGAVASFLLARGAVSRGADEAQRALDAARLGRAPAAQVAVERAKEEFDDAGTRLDGIATAPARLIPGLAQQVDAARTAVREGRRIAGTANDLVETADYDRLTYDGRIDLAQVRKLTGPTRRTVSALTDARTHLDAVRGGWLVAPLKDRLDDFSAKVSDAYQDSSLAAHVLEVTPALFGGDGDRRYLVVFITPAELRGAGGFIGSYAELTAVDGKVRLTRSGRIMDLIQAARPGERHISGPADYIERYGRLHPEDYLQDVTFSPDFPSDAQVLQQLYPQSGGRPVDGVISVDPAGLAALLKLTGPIRVQGLDTSLNAGNAEDVLLRRQYLAVPDEAERGEILTEATKRTFQELTEGSLPAPRAIANALSGPTREGHLRLWSPKEAEEHLFSDLGADGTIRLPVGADGFMVVQQNVGNNKLDAYLHRSIDYRATVDAATGDLRSRLTIELRNDVPGLDLPRAVIGNARGAPPGTNVASLSILTRQSVISATLDGKPIRLGPARERGLNAYDTTVLDVPPGGKVRLVVELTGGVDLTDGYDLYLQPQPVANPDRFHATVTVRNGKITGRDGRTATVVPDGPVSRPTSVHVPIHR